MRLYKSESQTFLNKSKTNPAWATVYQNTRGHAILIIASVDNAGADVITVQSDDSNPPTTDVLQTAAGANVVAFVVLANHYYKYTRSGAAATIAYQIEAY